MYYYVLLCDIMYYILCIIMFYSNERITAISPATTKTNGAE